MSDKEKVILFWFFFGMIILITIFIVGHYVFKKGFKKIFYEIKGEELEDKLNFNFISSVSQNLILIIGLEYAFLSTIFHFLDIIPIDKISLGIDATWIVSYWFNNVKILHSKLTATYIKNEKKLRQRKMATNQTKQENV